MAKFQYRMQNILNIKMKLEEQAKIAYGLASQKYQAEQKKLQEMLIRRIGYEKQLRSTMEGDLDLRKVRNAKEAVDSMRVLIRRQMVEVHKAEREMEDARIALSNVMIERKTHEKLKEHAFDDFKKELRDTESKEVDELVSYTYNAR